MNARNSLSDWVLRLERQILSDVPFHGIDILSASARDGMLIQSFLLVRLFVACILHLIRTVGRTCGGGILYTLLGPLDLFSHRLSNAEDSLAVQLRCSWIRDGF